MRQAVRSFLRLFAGRKEGRQQFGTLVYTDNMTWCVIETQRRLRKQRCKRLGDIVGFALGNPQGTFSLPIEVLRPPAFICVSTKVHNYQVFMTVVLVAEIGHCLCKGGLPAV